MGHQAMLDTLLSDIGLAAMVLAALVMFTAGLVKGIVGFALPMVAVSGLGSFLPATYAVAGLLLPALLTNIWQALRDGPRAALETVMKWWRLTLIVVVVIGCVAPFVAIMSQQLLFLILGVGVTGFTLLQLSGWTPSEAMVRHPVAEWLAGVFAGIFGGLAAVTGPPIVLYMLASNVKKAEQVRLQGIIFFLGLALLVVIHGQTGVLNASTGPLSVLLILPAFAGMALGLWVQDRMDQDTFCRATQVVLVIAGLNLLRRGLFA
jgi:uncharacterized membrane protein YfcA